MSPLSRLLRCEHCRETGTLAPVSPRVLRCSACSFLIPPSRTNGAAPAALQIPELPGIAPGGLLRGKYRLVERLGEGAHGVSYLAEHEYLSHLVVVKFLPHRVGVATDAAIRRLRDEARAGFRVHDPQVVRVLDCDVVRGIWYFVMEYIDGVNLAALLADELCLSWQQALEVGLDAAHGLVAIHAAGLLHRDIKPGNLLLGADGRARVADLGVAGLAHDRLDAAASTGATHVGTLAYTAPEMFAAGVTPGPAADVYSLGVTLFHLITGRLPHAGESVFRRLIDQQCRPAAWPADVAAQTPAWLVELLLQMLAIEPHERPASAEALIERLQAPAQIVRAAAPPRTPVDSLEPRAIGVLPFENERAAPDDDWLGYALANFLSRALAGLPAVYVADQDALAAIVSQPPGGADENPHRDVLGLARMVGAATVITGRFQRAGGRLHVAMDALRADWNGPRNVARVDCALADLAELERKLFDALIGALGLARAAVPARLSVDPPSASPPTAQPPVAHLGARENYVRGQRAFLRGAYGEAIRLGEQATTLAPDYLDAIGLVGVCLARLGKYPEAEAHHRRLGTLARERGDVRRQIEALANLGVMEYYRGRYEAAEVHYTEAARLAAQVELATEHAQICNNLGFVLFRLDRPAEAERAFLQAIKTHRAYGGLTSLIGPYNGMGNVLAEQQRYAEARNYYQRALALASEIGDRTSVGTTHMHIGRCAVQQRRFADAKHEFTMALNALEETRFWNGLARAYEYIAEMHIQLVNFDEAARCAEKRIELARQHANDRMEEAAWRQKAEALERAGKLDEAAECRARADELATRAA